MPQNRFCEATHASMDAVQDTIMMQGRVKKQGADCDIYALKDWKVCEQCKKSKQGDSHNAIKLTKEKRK